MKKLLLEVIFASEKRKEVLLLLEDGAREMEDILNTLDTTRQALLPQMRILEEHYLVSHLKDRYRLTSIGKLLVDNIRPLVNTLDFFETDIDYWGTHKLEFIPSHLLKRLNQLKHVTIIVPNTPFAFEMNRLFFEYIEKSKSLISVTSYLRDDFIQHFPRLIKNGIEMSYIINSELLEKLKENDNEYFRNCVKDGNIKFYLYSKDLGFATFGQNDHCIIFRLFTITGGIEYKHHIFFGQEALEWGKDFFDYYLKDSTPITEL